VEVEQQSKQIAIEKTEAEEALSAALPALETARLALEDLEKSDITEVRSFPTPPEAVQVRFLCKIEIFQELTFVFRLMQVVCECVLIIKGIKEISWKSARAMMSDNSFLRSLQELNCDAITQKQLSNVRAHMKVVLV
jgi:dynein heavy chain, axonemal